MHLTLQRWLGRWRHSVPGAWPSPGQNSAARQAPGWLLAWASRAGPHHNNQDCAGARLLPVREGNGLAVAVADGVTQAAAGEVAAHSLVQYWLGNPPGAEGAGRAAWLTGADAHVAAALAATTPEPGAATGAAAWLAPGGQGWCTRIGDCRVLRAQRADDGAWQVEALMPDQTVGTVFPTHYPDAAHPDALQPAHFAGCGRLGEPEWQQLALGSQDLLLLVSDGLHAALRMADWSSALAGQLPAGTRVTLAGLQAVLDDLIQAAQMLGSEDDITGLVVARDQGETP